MAKNKEKTIVLDPFQKWAHSYGRLGTLLAIIYMIAVPFIICSVYKCTPTIGMVLNPGTIGILLIYIPVGFSEAISYTPVMGSSAYLGFITGNIMNLKFPVAINGLKVAKVEQSTPEGDAVSAVSIAVSSIVTIIILAIAAALSSLISPIFQTPFMVTAKDYVIPALFGAMALGLFGTGANTSGKIVKGATKGVIPVIIIVSAVALVARIGGAGGTLLGLAGILIVLMIPVAILSSWIMFKKGMIKVVDAVPKAEAAPATEAVVEAAVEADEEK